MKTLLIVEDDPEILFALSTLLEGEGYAILAAENGLDALEKLEKHAAPHLILLDMKMPVMDGWQFAKAYRDRYGHLSPIVVMSAAADASQRAKEIQASAWIGKPFQVEDLLVLVKKHERE